MAEKSKDSENTEEDVQDMNEWALKKLNEIFIKNLPSDSMRDLPLPYMYTIAILCEVTFIFLFAYLIYLAYHEDVTNKFMSLSGQAGTCETIALPASGNFLVDRAGNWEGSDQFVYSNSQYQLVLNTFTGDEDAYVSMMEYFRQQVKDINPYTTRHNLATSLVLWMGSSLTQSINGQQQQFAMYGQPQSVFNKQYYQGSVGNVNDRCTAPSLVSYDYNRAIVTMDYSEETFVGSPSCINAMNPSVFGYDKILSGNLFKIQLDLNSMSVAMAVNSFLEPLNYLHVIWNGFNRTLTYRYSTFRVLQYFDSFYDNMDPILCVIYTGGPEEFEPQFEYFCGLQMGSMFVLPLLNHFGTGNSPQYCECNVTHGGPPDKYTETDRENCRAFDLLPGFLFYNTADSIDNIYAILELFYKFNSTNSVDDAAYNASYAIGGSVGAIDPIVNDREWREKSFEFCQTSYGNCSIVMMNVFDNITRGVNDYLRQLDDGFCTENLDVSDNAWSNMINNPPTPLTQPYWQCTESWDDAIFYAIGVGYGFIGLFTFFTYVTSSAHVICWMGVLVGTIAAIVVLACLPLIYLLLNYIGRVPRKEEYTRQDRDDAMASLSLQLLRMRDGKTKGIRNNGIVDHLTRELIDAAKADFGYPDSDDSDEEGDGKPISLKKGESIIHEDMVDPSTHQPLKTVDASTIQRQRVFTAHADGSLTHTHQHHSSRKT